MFSLGVELQILKVVATIKSKVEQSDWWRSYYIRFCEQNNQGVNDGYNN